MPNIKLIATDLDRTLLRTDKSISDYTAKVLQCCRAWGIKIVFATARPRRTVLQFFENVPADALVLHNGAVAVIKEQVILRHGIQAKTAQALLLWLQQDFPAATISVEIDDVLYANFDVSAVWNYTTAVRSDFTDLPDHPADKIIVGLSALGGVVPELPPELYFQTSENKLGLIMHQNATKWNALSAVVAQLGITSEEVITFGDDLNDIEMLRNARIGVTVANALPETKAAADFICGSNDEDGVARWIAENLL